jgi:hypothetical protein
MRLDGTAMGRVAEWAVVAPKSRARWIGSMGFKIDGMFKGLGCDVSNATSSSASVIVSDAAVFMVARSAAESGKKTW